MGWRWIFFVNVPVGAVALAITLKWVRETSDPDAGGIDWAGLFTFSGSLFCLLTGLIRGNDWGWGSAQTVGLLGAAALLLLIFFLAERAQRRPMLDLGLFRKPAFAGASLGAFAVSASLFAMFVYLTLYFQSVQGASPLETGLRFLPTTTLSFLVAAVAGRLTHRIPLRALLAAGLLFAAAGLWQMPTLEATSSWTAVLPGLVLVGIGFGIANPTLAAITLRVVPAARSGMASGMNSTCRQVGIATGIAALGALFQHEITRSVARGLRSLPGGAERREEIAEAFASGGAGQVLARAPVELHERLDQLAHSAYASALNRVFLVSAAIAVIGALLSAALVRPEDFVAEEAAAEDPGVDPSLPVPATAARRSPAAGLAGEGAR